MKNLLKQFLCSTKYPLFTLKKVAHKIHLWLGLAVGLIIIIISLTGCIYAFQEEIQNRTQPYRFVKKAGNLLPPSELKEIAQKHLPGKIAHRLKYGKSNEAAVVLFYNSQPRYFYLVYLNPYTGSVLKLKNMDTDFFRFILNGHFYLWLPPSVGQPVVAISTLIFFVMLITGIILWWPKNKAASKQRFRIKWDAKWRRRNYDLHNVFGFYACWILFFITITGLVWGFQWFSKSIYWLSSGGKELIEWLPVESDSTQVKTYLSPIDHIWKKTVQANPAAECIEIDFPENRKAVIGISTNEKAGTYWKQDNRFYDQYSLKEIPVEQVYGRFSNNLPVADKLRRMNYDIHVGGIFGITGKLIAFFASLVCASLPVTGFMIWWGRRNKTRVQTTAPVQQGALKIILLSEKAAGSPHAIKKRMRAKKRVLQK
ncbi:MAG TPA: PepSY-associated TM helix domain-containing protein [Bacteroidia bacterium]|nr:PepSY-associated TM helix domain-containing protein [Bacteroidia bacterium]